MICGGDSFNIIADSNNMRFKCFGRKDKYVVECNNCGLIQLNPFWTKQELHALYNDYWNQKDFNGQRTQRRISKYLFKYINNKVSNILEVGCGLGDNIRYLIKKGYVWVLGIDKDSNVCKGNIINKDIFEMDDSKYKFDFIFSVHVFEHMSDPYNFINKLILLLNKKIGNKIVFEFPNIEDPLLSMYKIKEFIDYYWYPYHAGFYSQKNIKYIFDSYNTGYIVTIKLRQQYGIINHLWWLFFRMPCNYNVHIPIIDDIYKWFLVNVFKKTDSMLVIMEAK
jgi:cyclopropane fatty-acyl-phospholipid synthase-like methyltransferase